MMLDFRRELMETKPLNIQAALPGADGIVIASDTKIVTPDGTRSTSHTSKIEVYPKFGLVCAWSGEDVAKIAANNLQARAAASKLHVDTTETKVEQIFGEAWKNNFGEEPTNYAGVQARRRLILAFGAGLQFWQFGVRPD